MFTDQNSQPLGIKDAKKTQKKKMQQIRKTTGATSNLIGNEIYDKHRSASTKSSINAVKADKNKIKILKKDRYLQKKDNKLLIN